MAKHGPVSEQVIKETTQYSGLPKLPTESKFQTPARPQVERGDPTNPYGTQYYETPSAAFPSPFSPFAPSSIWDEDGSPQDLASLPSSPPPDPPLDFRHRIDIDPLTKPQDPSSDYLNAPNPAPSPAATTKQHHEKSPTPAPPHQPLSRNSPYDIPWIARVPCLQCAVAQLPCDRALPSCSRCTRRGEAAVCLARRWITAEEVRQGLGSGRRENTMLVDFGAEKGGGGVDEDLERERRERRKEVAERVSENDGIDCVGIGGKLRDVALMLMLTPKWNRFSRSSESRRIGETGPYPWERTGRLAVYGRGGGEGWGATRREVRRRSDVKDWGLGSEHLESGYILHHKLCTGP
ncbi:hypothetical protein EV356DRAFT_264110 [Viridothelium virens]|uniref:Zn(2)-C6 fungal-type domain-containing protein n=1 Tax=Viridothelium virens TaxID=1048519 RepID=A0A6A6HKZ0_VIRVR|nr:hypothetical protein EV356DRAFT_264110 [Viridothelium virens]